MKLVLTRAEAEVVAQMPEMKRAIELANPTRPRDRLSSASTPLLAEGLPCVLYWPTPIDVMERWLANDERGYAGVDLEVVE